MTEHGDTADVVTLSLPAHVRHVATARVVASSLASTAGFDVDSIDDIRLAISEAAGVLLDGLDGDSGTRLSAEFVAGPSRLTVALSVVTADGAIVAPGEIDDLALRILAAVVDRFEVTDGVLTLEASAAGSAAV